MTTNSWQSFVERGEQSSATLRDRIEEVTPYSDGGEMRCGDCGSSCLMHTWSPRLQAYVGECCRIAEADLLPANYAAQQTDILESAVGLGAVTLIDQALAHLRLVHMQQSPDPHVMIAVNLLVRAREAA